VELLYLTANTKAGAVRRDVLEGKTHVVVPTVMMVSGVVPGSQGALYYPPSEMKKGMEAWNNKPAVVYHPEKNGKPTTAADPTVLNTQKVGVVLNAKYGVKNGKARWTADVWINEELGKQYMPEVMTKLDKGEPVEVSTGLYTENEVTEGEDAGKKYKAIARNYVPDHLAILPTGKGACSVADGAGLLQNAKAGCCSDCGEEMYCPSCAKKKTPTANAMSFGRLFSKISATLDNRLGKYNAFVEDVYPSFVVYSKRDDAGERKLFKQDYKLDKRKGDSDQVTLAGDPIRVDRITEYRTTDGKFVGNSLYAGNFPEETTMDKNALITKLIANSGGQLDEADRDWLAKKTPEWLKSLPGGPAAFAELTGAANPLPAAPAPVANATPVKIPTFNELLEAADPDTREMVAEGIASARAERSRLTAVVVANARQDYTDEELRTMGLKDLRRIAKFVGPKEQPTAPHFPVPSIPVANWAGAGGAVPPAATPAAAGNPAAPAASLPTLSLPASTKPVKA